MIISNFFDIHILPPWYAIVAAAAISTYPYIAPFVVMLPVYFCCVSLAIILVLLSICITLYRRIIQSTTSLRTFDGRWLTQISCIFKNSLNCYCDHPSSVLFQWQTIQVTFWVWLLATYDAGTDKFAWLCLQFSLWRSGANMLWCCLMEVFGGQVCWQLLLHATDLYRWFCCWACVVGQ